jgi:hypothetical protein
MNLIQLEPRFLRHAVRHDHEWCEEVELAVAQGVTFLCPKCFELNGGPVGTHSVLVWFRDRGVADNVTPGPGRWELKGMTLADITLAPSISLSTGCKWHGFVTNGAVSSCG